MPFAVDDLDEFLDDDYAVPVSANGVSSKGIPEKDSIVETKEGAVVVKLTIIARTDLFGDLKIGNQFTVNGVAHRVQYDPMRFDDGSFCRVPLSDPTTAIPEIIGVSLTTVVGVPLVALPGS